MDLQTIFSWLGVTLGSMRQSGRQWTAPAVDSWYRARSLWFHSAFQTACEYIFFKKKGKA